MTHGYEILPLADPALIRAFLGNDAPLTAYALGDLDPALWPDSEFVGALVDDQLVALVLFYHGLEPTIITAFGDQSGVRAIFDHIALPSDMYCLLPDEVGDLIMDYYALSNSHREWRMVLARDQFTLPELGAVRPIEPAHADQLEALYQHAANPGEAVAAFSPAQIAQGCFYGVWVDSELIATAGTHIWSPGERIAAIGNVFTRPDYRGHGYATQCTAAVVRDALAASLQTIVLNVRQDNAAAIRVYEKLGFTCYHVFLEGPGVLHGATST